MVRTSENISDRISRSIPKYGAWLTLLFLMMPSLVVIPISFAGTNEMIFPPTKWSFHLYQEYLTDLTWVSATILSIRVALGAMIISLLLGVPAAYGLVRGRFLGRRLIAVLLLSPALVPAVVIALSLYIYFTKIGLANGELRLIMGQSIVTLPFTTITAMSGLRQIDPNLETAAGIMGANRVTVFRRVTIPLLLPAIFGGALFSFLLSFDEVVIAWFVSPAGYTTLPVKMFSSVQWGISPVLAAISTMLTVLSALICVSVAAVQRSQ